MRAVIQRVTQAKVEVDGSTVGQIERGLLVYVSVGKGDGDKDAQFIAEKIVNLRVFADKQDKMNLSVKDVGGSILLVSNFTLHGNCQKGRRPGFDEAAEPQMAKKLYETVIELVKKQGIEIQTGIFAAHMHISSVNDGPVTFILESRAGDKENDK
jgi:D-tyrosyl-tRNA(Tyr) deacylase